MLLGCAHPGEVGDHSGGQFDRKCLHGLSDRLLGEERLHGPTIVGVSWRIGVDERRGHRVRIAVQKAPCADEKVRKPRSAASTAS
jgi:hypothetical protein